MTAAPVHTSSPALERPDGAPRPRVAVIGSGIAGLVSARTLDASHDVTVFEARDRLGGHTHTVSVDHDGEQHEIDTGFIVFNREHYPVFSNLLDELGVPSRASCMSFSVRCDDTGLEYNGTSVNRLFAQRRNLLRPRFIGMVRDILRFGRTAPALVSAADDRTTVDEFVARHGFGRAFLEDYLLPIGAALWSSPAEVFGSFPIRFVVAFLEHHRMLEVNGRPVWRTVEGGSRRYIDAIVPALAARVRLRTPVRSVQRLDGGAIVTTPEGDERFDHVIMACHADQALRIVAAPTDTERTILGAFPYQANDVVLHTDERVLPRTRRAWASWNYHRPAASAPGEGVAVTYNMNMLQGLRSRHTYCVTLNRTAAIEEGRVLGRYTYHHPLFGPGCLAAQARHAELIDHHGISYCGAYWGFGFHEDGARSARDVSRRLLGVRPA